MKSVESTAVRALEIRDQYEFYSKWYHSAIRSLIDMYPFKDDYSWLAKNVYPPITREAKNRYNFWKTWPHRAAKRYI